MVVDVLDVGIVSLHWRLAFAGVGLGPSVCCCWECYDGARTWRRWHEGGWSRFAGLHATCELCLCAQDKLAVWSVVSLLINLIIINLKSCYFDKDNQRYAHTHICVKGVLLHCASFPAQELFSEAPSAIGH